MPKLNKQETEIRRQQARDLYIKGFDIPTIADLIGMAPSTVAKWAELLHFDDDRRARQITISEMRETILDSFQKLKAGQKPSISPDAAAKYAKAFEQLSDRRRCLPHMFEAYDILTDRLTLRVQSAHSKADREAALAVVKIVRQVSQQILTDLIAEQNN